MNRSARVSQSVARTSGGAPVRSTVMDLRRRTCQMAWFAAIVRLCR